VRTSMVPAPERTRLGRKRPETSKDTQNSTSPTLLTEPVCPVPVPRCVTSRTFRSWTRRCSARAATLRAAIAATTVTPTQPRCSAKIVKHKLGKIIVFHFNVFTRQHRWKMSAQRLSCNQRGWQAMIWLCAPPLLLESVAFLQFTSRCFAFVLTPMCHSSTS
jgi:hypothetical protein